MAAEAPDLHKGDLGRLEEVRNALIGADINGHRESTKWELFDCFALGVRRRSRQHFYFNEHSKKLFSSATESQKQILHAYMGHPVYVLLKKQIKYNR